MKEELETRHRPTCTNCGAEGLNDGDECGHCLKGIISSDDPLSVSGVMNPENAENADFMVYLASLEARAKAGKGFMCEKCVKRIETQRETRRVRLHHHEMIDKLPPSLQDADLDAMKNVANLAEVKARLVSAADQRRPVFHFGKPGSGKTTMHAAIYGRMAAKGLLVEWVSITDIFDRIRATYRKGAQHQDADIVNSLFTSAKRGALFIEDIGYERVTDHRREFLYRLVDKVYQYRAEACLFITSNCNLKQLYLRLMKDPSMLTRNDDEALGERTAAWRIVRRLTHMCELVHNEADDYFMRHSNQGT